MFLVSVSFESNLSIRVHKSKYFKGEMCFQLACKNIGIESEHIYFSCINGPLLKGPVSSPTTRWQKMHIKPLDQLSVHVLLQSHTLEPLNQRGHKEGESKIECYKLNAFTG